MGTITALKKLNGFRGAQVFFAGGYVRDFLRRKRNNDIDIVVRNIDAPQIRKFLNNYGGTKVVNLTFGVPVLLFKAFRDSLEAQIVFPRNGEGQFNPLNTLKEDAAHRDFTINAMYLPVHYRSRNELIDFFGGYRDIKKRVLSAVGNPDERIMESPIRILRALSLASRTKYRIRGDLMNSMRNHVELLKRVPAEIIRGELNKILLHDKPSRYFKMMHKLGILKVIMPELDACVGVKQDKKYHKYDVFKHCLYTCDHIDPDLVLRLAAILHDVGKPDTRKRIKGRTTFHKHEVVSTQLAKNFLQRSRYSKETIKKVLHLIRLHMYHYVNDLYVCTNINKKCRWQKLVGQIGERVEIHVSTVVDKCPKCGSKIVLRSGWSDAAVRRFIRKTGITRDDLDDLGNLPLFKLRKAERKGNGFKTIPVTDRQLDFEKRIREVFEATGAFELKDLDIDGAVIMEIFNMEQSPRVGEILDYLLGKVASDKKLNNSVELVKIAAEYIYYKM